MNNSRETNKFCALIRKTEKIKQYLSKINEEVSRKQIAGIRKNIIQSESAFSLLKDSKHSFTIEGENPKSKRAARWGTAIGQAGLNYLSKEKLKRIQQLVIENTRFVEMGLRKKGGFVGEHDRVSCEPIPEYIVSIQVPLKIRQFKSREILLILNYHKNHDSPKFKSKGKKRIQPLFYT